MNFLPFATTNPESDRVNHGIERRSGGTEAMAENRQRIVDALRNAANNISITGPQYRQAYQRNIDKMSAQIQAQEPKPVSVPVEPESNTIINREVIESKPEGVINYDAVTRQADANAAINRIHGVQQ